MNELDSRMEQLTPLLASVCRKLQDEVLRMGFEPEDISIGELADAEFWLDKDPASGEHSLMGEWRDDKGMKVGSLAFHADGSFFAEHDVIRTHPAKPHYFVEAVTAWGRDEVIKSEPRLLPMVS